MKKIKVGVSACLLGERVRYDGQHKLDHYIVDTLGPFFDYVPVCPEVECGLSVPREAMRLEGNIESPRLMTIHTRVDLTDKMLFWVHQRVEELEKENLCGYIFKTKSPSSGMKSVKVFNPETGIPSRRGTGLFARAFMERYPLLPVEDEGRLNNPAIRENFIERVFAFSRWQDLGPKPSKRKFLDFHTQHKLLLMAHSNEFYRKLGRIAAAVSKNGTEKTIQEYFPQFMKALSLSATVKKQTNVLQHIMGYFKKYLSTDEKLELLEVIESYHNELVPLIVPITLLKHYIRKFDQQYLKEQVYLNPHPFELSLRNHV